jgi:hypothetical protein
LIVPSKAFDLSFPRWLSRFMLFLFFSRLASYFIHEGLSR